MLSLRLKTIASLVDKNASVVDIGTDHAYIPIYLVQNKITNKVMASDVSSKVLENALNNIKKNKLDHIIETRLSDGLKNISEDFDVAIISGMGTNTIKKILNVSKIPNTLIIQSNNDLDELRRYLNSLGYKIIQEIVVYDERYYSIIKYQKGSEELSEEEILFGKSNNLDYYKYLSKKYNDLYKKSNNKVFFKYYEMLNKIIERKQA